MVLAAAALVAAPVTAAPPQAPSLREQVEAVLAAAPAGTRFGLLVVDGEGREILAINPDQRFVPASDTKLFTTAAAFALLAAPADQAPAATIAALVPRRGGDPDVVLAGRGGASLSTGPDCTARCMDAVAAAVRARTGRVHDIIGDDRWFPDQRWSPGMSWNNIGTVSGTAASALVVDDNVLPLLVSPGAAGQPPTAVLSPYLALVNDALTVAEGPTRLLVEPAINERAVRLSGQIAVGAEPWRAAVGIDDPAAYAAWALRRALAAQGVKVGGRERAVHRPLSPADDPVFGPAAAPAPGAVPGEVVATIAPPPLAEEIAAINKLSQNLHAELVLRRMGRIAGTGSLAQGLAAEQAVFDAAGVPRSGYDLADGSGMSTYNRASPRAVVALLRWASGQPWGAAWRATLPVGGVDGTLRRRFATTLLRGNIAAKTGTLNASTALSGFMRAASGRELVFAAFANDIPAGEDAVAALDGALVMIALAD